MKYIALTKRMAHHKYMFIESMRYILTKKRNRTVLQMPNVVLQTTKLNYVHCI